MLLSNKNDMQNNILLCFIDTHIYICRKNICQYTQIINSYYEQNQKQGDNKSDFHILNYDYMSWLCPLKYDLFKYKEGICNGTVLYSTPS